MAGRKEVLEVLAEYGCLSAKEVAEKAGADRAYVRALLRRMAESGEVQRVGWGVYCYAEEKKIPEPPPPHLLALPDSALAASCERATEVALAALALAPDSPLWARTALPPRAHIVRPWAPAAALYFLATGNWRDAKLEAGEREELKDAVEAGDWGEALAVLADRFAISGVPAGGIPSGARGVRELAERAARLLYPDTPPEPKGLGWALATAALRLGALGSPREPPVGEEVAGSLEEGVRRAKELGAVPLVLYPRRPAEDGALYSPPGLEEYAVGLASAVQGRLAIVAPKGAEIREVAAPLIIYLA